MTFTSVDQNSLWAAARPTSKHAQTVFSFYSKLKALHPEIHIVDFPFCPWGEKEGCGKI